MACGVFASILSSFVLFLVLYFVLFLVLLLLCLHPFISLSFFVLLHCFCDSLGVGVVSFSLSVYTQKERALRVGASSLVLLWVVGLLCKIWFSVLIKFVIINLDFFSYAFVRVSIFVIIPPLLEKTFKHTPDKFPRVELVFYALIYVI